MLDTLGTHESFWKNGIMFATKITLTIENSNCE